MENISGVLTLCESMPITNKDVGQKIIAQIKTIASTANTLDELFSLEHQLDDVIAKREIDAITPTLDNIENDSHINPNSVMAWNQVKNLLGQYGMFKLQVAMAVSANNKKRLADKEGITVDEANTIHRRSPSDCIDCRNTLYEYAARIMGKMINYYNEKITIHDKEFQELLRVKLAVETVLITEMLEYIIPRNISEDTDVNWLAALAQCYHFMLEAYLFHGDEAYSFMLKGREEAIQKLANLYSQIEQLAPDFESPELPDPVGINIPESYSENNANNQQATNSSGGCYVATAVYGSYDCPEVWTLRRFRDNILAETWYGRAFIRTYYAISPTLVRWFGKTEWFKNLWKPTLDRMVEKLNGNGVEDTPYDDRAW